MSRVEVHTVVHIGLTLLGVAVLVVLAFGRAVWHSSPRHRRPPDR